MWISFFVNQKWWSLLAANPLFIHTMVLAYHAPCLYNIFHCHSHNPTAVHNNPTTAILLCLHNPSILLLQPLATLHKKSQSNPCEFNDTLNDVWLWSDYISDPMISTLSAGMYISCLWCIMLLTDKPQDLQKQSESVSPWIRHLIFALL